MIGRSVTLAPPSASRRGPSGRLLAHCALVAAVVVAFAPLVWMVGISLKAPSTIFAQPLDPVPWPPTFVNFASVLATGQTLREMANSVVFAAAVTAGQTAVAVPAAYAFARLRFRGADTLLACLLVTLPVPFTVLYVPDYLLVSRLGLAGTYAGLILPQLASAYGVFLLRQHFAGVPASLVEAARMDGAGEWDVMWRIVFPIARPAAAALAIVVFIATWNEYVWPALVAPEPALRVLAVGVTQFSSSEGGTQWGPTMAAATLASVPTALAYLLFRKHVVAAVAEGAVRG